MRAVHDLELAVEAARRGAVVLMRYWEQIGSDDAEIKDRNDWVSRADRESEAAIVQHLQAACPADTILGEESGLTAGAGAGNDRTWIIDPLDGTSNYLQHFPFWSVSIGLRQADQIVAAVVYEPLRELFFTAERGAGAFRNGVRMAVSKYDAVEGAFLATGFPFRSQQFVAPYCAVFQDVIALAKGVRRAGSAALDLAYTAAGVFDGFFELQLAPWDIAAGSLLIAEAGGVITDFSGGGRWLDRGNVVGAPPTLHRELLALINRHVKEPELDRRPHA